MKIGWEWWLLGSSVLAGLIFLVVILAIKKTKNGKSLGASAVSKTSDNGNTAWKSILAKLPTKKKLIFFVILGLFIWFFFPQLKLWFKFKGVERAQIAKAIKPLETRLDILAEKAKSGEGLTNEEATETQSLKKAIVAAKKKVKEGPPSPPKTTSIASIPVYKWVFEFKPEPEDIMKARKERVDQISYRENEVVNKPYFDKNEIRFKYKTSKGKVIYAILDKKNPNESHFLGMVDLPDQPGKPQGRKLIIRLKETSMPDSFDGNIETWDGENWYPVIPAFLKKVPVQ